MRHFNKITLSSAPFYASLVVVIALAIFVSLFWGINEYQVYEESIENIRNNYEHQYRLRLEEELDKIVDVLDYRRLMSDLRVERDLRERVQSAYTIASHHYRLYKDVENVEELRSKVVELLRPIRWNNGRGYYFSGRVEAGVVDLFADEPFFEGKTAAEFAKISGRDVLTDIVSIVRDREAGVHQFDLQKPEYHGKSYPVTAFVKYFAPLDWFIGAAIYNDHLEKNLQQEILTRIQSSTFGNDGQVFCFREDGTILTYKDARFVGRSVLDLVDSNEGHYGRDFLRAGVSLQQEGYVHYVVPRQPDGVLRQKLGFVKKYEDWGWILGTTMFMDAMERAIQVETETYRRISFKNVFTFTVLFGVAIAFLLFSTFFYSLKIKQGITLFTNFFREAADSNVKIRDEELSFREFENLARLANRMVDNRVKNELLLHRDELRLDTLLRLGMMEKYSLQDKYDFILRRIVQITRSEEGYLALVNAGQTHITVCSYIVANEQDIRKRQGELTLPLPVERGGLPGKAVMKKTAIISNVYKHTKSENIFPYRYEIHRHLDVPIYNDGKIVVVAGVCNNSEKYDNSDIRQMTMLLEGMWLHVVKKCAEEELAKLERQIIAVSEEERSNIGRDLHDDLGSHLTGVELLSKVLQQRLQDEVPQQAEQMGTIRGLIRDAIEKTRRLSQGLYPVHVIEYGLEAAIEELVVEVKKMFNINFDLLWEGAGETLGNNTATHLHYIIREAVFNAARHGKPKNIGVYVQLDGGSFSVKITDDGSGFNETPAATGMGFHTMKYRAKAIGALLTTNSSREGGTVVSVTGEVVG